MLKKKKYAKWGGDDGGPDWGDLKHNEKEEEPCLKKAPEVGSKLVYLEFQGFVVSHIAVLLIIPPQGYPRKRF